MTVLLAIALNLTLFVLATSVPQLRAAHHHWIFPGLAALLAAQWAATLLPGRGERRLFRSAVVSLMGVLLAIGVARHATILACFEDCAFKLALAGAIISAVCLGQRLLREEGFWGPLRSELAAWGALLWAAYLVLFGLHMAPWTNDLAFMILALLFWLGRTRAVFLALAASIVAALAVRATGNEYAIIALGLLFGATPLLFVVRLDAWLAERARRPPPVPAESSRARRLLRPVARAVAIGGTVAAIGFYAVGPTFLMTNPEKRRALLRGMAPARVTEPANLSPLAARLREHVVFLSQTVGERNAFQPREQERALAYIEQQFKAAGYAPRRLEYGTRGLAVPRAARFANVEAALPAAPAKEDAWILGAHWDSAPGTPGADDNASGVAVLLEVARAMRARRLPREFRFVAFGTEEPPAFGSADMGSYQYAVHLKENGVRVHGMISLEMLGYFNPRPGSQLYPPFLHLVNPSRGDYVGAVSNMQSRGLLRAFRRDWEAGSTFPLTTAVLPGAFSSLALSDQLNFWSLGFPALMLSDTAFYRNPHYHQESDLPDTLDYERMAAVTEALIRTLDPDKAARERNEIDDASRLNRTPVTEIIAVKDEHDVRRGLEKARALGLPVSLAGRRHSMGGQTFARDGVVLDMTKFNSLSYDKASQTLTAGAGATWKDIQRALDPVGRAVKVMQSDNIFSLGGSLSVNVHGWHPRSPPLASTVKSLRLMLADGTVLRCSRTENSELFGAALGGYGLLGVILDAELETVPNELYRKEASHFPAHQYADRLHKALQDPRVGLAYGRLSVDAKNFLREASLNVYKRAGSAPPLEPMADEGFVALKRKVFRASETSDEGKRRRWLVERSLGSWLETGGVTRNTIMNPDISVLSPADPGRRDILHEYFVPYSRLNEFLAALRASVPRHRQNLLNVTLRDVRRDEDTLLAYARTDVCAAVLFFSQEATPEGGEGMRAMTRELIDKAAALGGSFYLPYRLDYTREQFLKAYPRAPEFFALKRRHDPGELFQSEFYRHIRPSERTAPR